MMGISKRDLKYMIKAIEDIAKSKQKRGLPTHKEEELIEAWKQELSRMDTESKSSGLKR